MGGVGGLLVSVARRRGWAAESFASSAGPGVTAITITVLLSVLAHGATADPIARLYAAKLASAEGESGPSGGGGAD